MNSLLSKLEKYRFVHFIILIALLVATFFNFSFYICLIIYLFLVSAFQKSSTLIYTYIFLYPVLNVILSPYLIELVITFFLIKNFIFSLLKKEIHINKKVLILVFIIGIFLCLPFHEFNGSTLNYVRCIFSLLRLYFVYEYRHTLSIHKIARLFSLSLVLSGFCWVFRDYSEQMQSLMKEEFDVGGVLLNVTEPTPTQICFLMV